MGPFLDSSSLVYLGVHPGTYLFFEEKNHFTFPWAEHADTSLMYPINYFSEYDPFWRDDGMKSNYVQFYCTFTVQ